MQECSLRGRTCPPNRSSKMSDHDAVVSTIIRVKASLDAGHASYFNAMSELVAEGLLTGCTAAWLEAERQVTDRAEELRSTGERIARDVAQQLDYLARGLRPSALGSIAVKFDVVQAQHEQAINMRNACWNLVQRDLGMD